MIKEMSKKLNIIRILVAILLLFGLFVFSEVLYALSNKHLNNIFISYHLFQFKRNLEKDNCTKTLNHFFKLTDIVIKYRHKKNPKQIPKNYSILSHLDVQDSCNKLFFTFELPEINYLYKPEILDANLSYIYYSSGIKAEEMGFSKIASQLFQTAIYLNPDLSHYHVELANFFLWVEDRDKAKEALEYCLKFEYSQEHCKDFKDNNYSQSNIMKVGFLKETIEKIINR